MTMSITKTILLMMMMMMTATTLVDSQKRSDVCVDDTTHPHSLVKRPDMGPQFRVDVECNLQEQKGSVYVREYYDYSRNRGRLTKTRGSRVSEFYLDYDKGLILQVDPQTGQCDAGLLVLQPSEGFIFGFTSNGLQTHMFSPSAAMHFGGNVTEVFVNRTTIRGINVNHWRSCQYIASLNATAQVDWYFSDTEHWNMQQGGGSAPVRMTAAGKMVLSNQTVVPFSHVYDFFNFRPTVDPTDFQVPDGVFCPGRTLVDKAQPFPTIPKNFYFVGETADNIHHRFNVLEEYFDNKTGLALYKVKMDIHKMTGMDRYLVLNDYSIGVSYLLDSKEGSCQMLPITKAPVSFSEPINGKEVRMETPREFFVDTDIVYQYTGTVTARNIPAERWVGWTSKAHGFQGSNVTVVWYFATSQLQTWNQGLFRTPIQLRVFLPNTNVTQPTFDFNIFYYNVNKALISQVDTSACFADALQLPLRFFIPKSEESVMRKDIEGSKMAIQNAIQLYTGIDPTRVSDIKLYFGPSAVEVSLTLLGKPPSFADVPNAMAQNSLCDAAKFLQDAFNNNQFKFYFADGTAVETVSTDSSTLESLTGMCGISTGQQNNLYSTGSFAGLAVGMLVAGSLGGALGGFMFFK